MGSTLCRPCVCSSQGASFCVVHRFLQHGFTVGERLWHLPAYETQKLLRTLLEQLQVPRATAYTLKAFRAGKATTLALEGAGIAAILAAGEWRSQAFLRYVSETEIDKSRALQCALEEDDQDDEILPIL